MPGCEFYTLILALTSVYHIPGLTAVSWRPRWLVVLSFDLLFVNRNPLIDAHFRCELPNEIERDVVYFL